jgi:hypothetical protein
VNVISICYYRSQTFQLCINFREMYALSLYDAFPAFWLGNMTLYLVFLLLHLNHSRHSSVGIALGYGLDDRVLGFDSRRGLGILLFTIASRTALGYTQPPIQWVPEALSLGVKRLGREADHSSPSSAEVKG